MTQRNPNIDAIRVIAAFGVVWLHVSVWVLYGDPSIHSSGWWAATVIDAFTHWGVPAFVMVSGALTLSAPADLTPLEFWIKRLRRLLPAIIFWTLVFFAFRRFLEGPFGLRDALKSLVEGTPYGHLWYLYMLLGLTFISPFLHKLVQVLNRRDLLLLILGCFAIAAGETAFGGRAVTWLPGFIPFIGYFLAGYYLATHARTPRRWWLVVIFFLCGLAIVLSTAVLLPRRDVQAYDLTFSYHNPLVAGMSLSIFLLLLKAPGSFGPLIKLAPITLGIYVIHPLWIWALAKLGLDCYWVHPAIGIPLTATLAFILSALSALLLARIPWLRHTVS
mgnify:FL=1